MCFARSAGVQNAVGLGDYATRIAAGALATDKGYALTAEDRLRADLIERVMCDFTIDIASVVDRHNVDPMDLSHMFPRLAPLLADGLVEQKGQEIRVTPAPSGQDGRVRLRRLSRNIRSNL